MASMVSRILAVFGGEHVGTRPSLSPFAPAVNVGSTYFDNEKAKTMLANCATSSD
jgi:hypothetical protein